MNDTVAIPTKEWKRMQAMLAEVRSLLEVSSWVYEKEAAAALGKSIKTLQNQRDVLPPECIKRDLFGKRMYNIQKIKNL